MNKFDGLVGNRSGSRKRGFKSREASREPRLKFNEHSNNGRTLGSKRGRGNPSSSATGSKMPKNPKNIRALSTGSRPVSNGRPTRETYVNARGSSTGWHHSNEGELNPAFLTGVKFQSLKQRIKTYRRDIFGMQHRWPQRSNLLTDPWRRSSKDCPGPMRAAKSL